MAGQTVTRYGNVVFYHCLTNRFEQVEERDPSGADPLYYSYSIGIIGYVHGKSITSGIRTEPTASDAPGQYRTVGNTLSEVRADFKMEMGCDETGNGGTILIEAKPATADGAIEATRDVNNGPRCTRFAILQVVSDEIFKVEATFHICLPTCIYIQNQSRVLSNRWSVLDEIDADRITTRTYSGRLRVSAGKVNPNSFRNLVVPALAPGMRRHSMVFECSADGLWLNYTVVDREAVYSAPPPATSWDIAHTESTGDGIVQRGEISVTLHGHRNVNKKELIALGVKIFDDRLRGITNAAAALQNRQKPQHIVEYVSVTDYTSTDGAVRIGINGRVLHAMAGGDPLERNLQFQANRLGSLIGAATLPGYDSNLSLDGRPGEVPQVQGQIPLVGAFVTYLQTHCQPDHGLHCGGTVMLDAQNSHCPTPEVQIRTVAAIPDQPPDYYSSTNADGMYTSYQAESLYATDHNSVAMPIAGQVSGGSSDVDTVAVIKLAPPSTTRKHKIKGSRAGKAPELPKPAESYIDGGKVAKLLKFLLLPIVPFRAADGSQIFQVSAEYHYALTRPAKPEDTLRLGVNPWEKSGLISSQPAMVNTYTEDTKQAN